MLKRNEYQSESDARMQKELQMARSEAEFKGERVSVEFHKTFVSLDFFSIKDEFGNLKYYAN